MPKLASIAPSMESTRPLLQPITVVNRQLQAHCHVMSHSHLWGQFVYASQGVLAVNTPAARYLVTPEQGVWVNSNISHSVTAITEVRLTSFYLDESQCQALPEQSCVLNVAPFLHALIQEARLIPSDFDWQGPRGRLLRLIRDWLSEAKNAPFHLPYSSHPKLMQLFGELQNNPANQDNIATWGQRLGASSRTLSRLIKAETGLSYRHWRQRLNLQLSLSLLAQGHSINHIADSLGYASPSAFIHMFKQQTGDSPARYRK
ncbi:transcriptional regulator, AraC family [Shewanella denitrificans OS217]|uniref:Transcriptional regulator, AraC family n=3 Tax=Shewanella TaxID=22 RepID=Q12RM6_SHEDO|nr:transcriptional regulator, AraC family [Shewanella denitrificans OS217]